MEHHLVAIHFDLNTDQTTYQAKCACGWSAKKTDMEHQAINDSRNHLIIMGENYELYI
jgi:hypothetical protein